MAEPTPGAAPANEANPANPQPRRVTAASRVPMSLPNLKLQVPEIPGWFLYWHLAGNVPKALKAGYEFVMEDEVSLNNFDLAGNAATSGNSDMGTRVSVLAGGLEEGSNQAARLYLMKLPQEWRDADMASLENRNEQIAKALRGGTTPEGQQSPPGETPDDRSRRYLKTGQDLFFPRGQKIRAGR